MSTPSETLLIEGLEVKITNPDKIFFPKLGVTKMDLVEYYLAVADGALRGCRDRPTSLKRFPDGAEGFFFFQKRVPEHRPEWIQTAHVKFPSGRTADFMVITDAASLAWVVNLGCLEVNPWPVRKTDVDHPDELRVDLDPTPEADFEQVKEVALECREVLEELGLRGFSKTSGSRGIHINVRIEPRWEFPEVRRAALAFARRVEQRIPDLATTAWWKEERHGVFIDYNQNARDRTVASAYSVRPTPDARVSCPLTWEELPGADPADLTLLTVPARFKEIGDPAGVIDESSGSLEPLLELAARDEASGEEDAPWPPHFPKQPGEKKRVAPSRARKPKPKA